jgi:ribosomal protein L7/L12
MATATELLEKRLSQGSSLEVALADLRQTGTSPIEAIKAVRSVLRVNLGEAKRIFSASSAWHAENEAADLLHTQILTVLQND